MSPPVIVSASAGANRVSVPATENWPVLTVTPAVPLPLPVTRAKSPMYASVVLVTIGTVTAAPTPAEPPPEMLPAIALRTSVSSAATRTLPSAVTTAASLALVPWPMYARVQMVMTGTSALTVTAAEPPKPAPTEIEVIVSLDVASTVTLPRALTEVAFPIQASVSLVMTSTSMPAPTPAEPPIASAPASERICVVSLAATATDWVAAAPVWLPFTVVPLPT